MRAQLLRRLEAVALVLALPATAFAGGVRIVTPLGDLNFPDIASAVAAAQEGDVLLVGEGTYGGFTIDGKSLSIWAAPPGAFVDLTGPITVRNLAEHQHVVLSGLSVGIDTDKVPGLSLVGIQGWARLQDCSFESNRLPGFSLTFPHGGAGAFVSGCSRVAFLRCLLRGGVGADGFDWEYCDDGHCSTPAGDGGHGLEVTGSRVALYDCEVWGEEGGDVEEMSFHCCDPGRGGDGIRAVSSEVFGSGSRFWGATGGWASKFHWAKEGEPGCGVWVDGQSVIDSLDCVIGCEAWECSAKCGPGWLTPLPGTAHEVLAPTIVPELGMFNVELAGLLGDAVWLPRSKAMDHWLYLPLVSVWLIPRPLRMPRVPAATLPTGTGVATVPPLWVHSAMTHQEWILQGMFVHPDEARLGSARHVLGLSLTIGPDCNNNGTSDYIDVLFGGAPDDDHDLIPDTCPGG